MGKILYTRTTESGAINYISGTIAKIRENSDDKHPYVISINASVYDGQTKSWTRKTIELMAWKNGSRDRISAVKRMKPHVGSFVTCTTGNISEYQPAKGDSILQTTIFGLSYSNKYDFEDGGKEFTILTGSITDITENDNGSAVVSVKARVYDSDTKNASDETFNCNLSAKLYDGLKKVDIKKGGTLAAIGELDGDSLDVKRAEYGERPPKDDNGKKGAKK